MKQSFKILAVALAIVAAASCSKEIENPVDNQPSAELVPTTISASIDATKATVASDGKTLWQENDAIAVWIGGTKYEMSLIEGAGTKSAVFKGNLPAEGTISAAVAPASAASSTAGVPVPEFSQTIAAGATCDPAALIMSAGAPVEGNLSFQNACGGARFTVGAGIKSILVYCNEGQVSVALPETAGTFDVFLPAAEYTNILIVATDANDVAYGVKLPKNLNIKRSVITNLGTLAGEPCTVINNATNLQAYLADPQTDAFIVKDIVLTEVTLASCESFGKTLDGMGHSLKNWVVNAPMFTTATAESVIKNIVIDESCQINPVPGKFGALASTAAGLVENCVNNAPAAINNNEATQYQFGALVGRLEGQIKNCVNNGEINIVLENSTTASADAQTMYFGGLVGILGTPQEDPSVVRIDGCRNTGAINYTINNSLDGANSRIAHGFVGGILGSTGVNKPAGSETKGYVKNYGVVKGCENSGNITFNHPDGGSGMYAMVGGIAGYAESPINECVNSGAITYLNSMTVANAKPAIGGIAGAIAHSAKDCSNSGTIRLEGMFANGGGATANTALGVISATAGGCFGVIGIDATVVDNCDNSGVMNVKTTMNAAQGSSSCYAGVVGYNVSTGEFKNCDNTGELNLESGSKTAHMAGVVAYNCASVSNCTNSGILTGVQNTTHISDPTAAVINIGGVVGYNCDAVVDCTNNAEKMIVRSSGGSRVGGVVSMYGKGTKVCDGCVNHADIDFVKTADIAANFYLGGVVGVINVTSNLTKATNTGNLTAKLTSKTTKSYAGGICSTVKPAKDTTSNADDCTNTGSVSVDGGNMVLQFFIGGCFGACEVGSKVFFNRCVNRGEVSLSNVNCPGSFVYAGGMLGGYATAGPNLDACENYGKLITTCASKMRIGGVAGAANSTLIKSVQQGEVIMENATSGSMAGALGGYFSGTKIEGSSVKGKLTVKNCANTSAGGVIGENGTTATRAWHSATVDVQIESTADRNGFFIGQLFDNATAGKGGITLGKADGPVTFASTCSLNGNAIPSTPSVEDLCGEKKTAAAPLNLTNVVVE